ncbi:MAG: transglutaminase domain-containing protein [Alphaproteobacteria bacterium]
MSLRGSSLVALAVAAVLTTVGARAADLGFPDTGAPAETVLPPLPEIPVATIDLGVLRDHALDLAAAFPAADYDVQALAATFAGDPAAAYAYVRDRILIDPYPGAMRSPAGVLGARAGSSADRAALLVELLRYMDIEARFAFGTLDDAGVLRLRAAGLMPHTRNLAEDEIGTLAGLSGAAAERMAARARRDFAWLWAAIGDRLTPAEPQQPTWRHVWAQALIDGDWVDLDPLPFNDFGATVVASTGTTADTLPSQVVNGIVLTVVAESLSDGALTTQALLEAPLLASEAADTHIFLAFEPAAAGGAGAIGSGITGALGVEAAYLPVLTVGSQVLRGDPLPALAGGGDSGGGMFSGEAQDFFFGGGEEPAIDTGPALTALYLDFVLYQPWQRPLALRRVLVDRVAPEARMSGLIEADGLAPLPVEDGVADALATMHQIVVSTGGANPHHVATGIGMAAEYVGEQMATPEAMSDLSLPEILWPIGALNAAVVLASEELSITALNDLDDVRFFVGAPRVFVLSFQPAAIGSHDGLRFEIDLLHDEVATVSNPGVSAAAVAERRLWYAVLQSALETTLAELRTATFDADGRHVVSTSTEMAAALAVLAPADAAGLAAPTALLAALAAGDLVVANAGSVAPDLQTWWTVDPADGSARAVLAPGLGGSGGGGWRPPTPYTNATPNTGDRIIVDPRTGNNAGFVRNGRDHLYRRPPPAAGTCRGANEYTTILGCVSLPAGMALGTAYSLVIGEVVFFAAVVIASAM